MAVLLGWLIVVSSYWAINGVIFLSHPEQHWGELGFESTSVLMSLFLSGGYAFAVIAIFIPFEYLKRRKSGLRNVVKEAIIGGAAWGFSIPLLSGVVANCIMGGSLFSDLMVEIVGFLSVKGAAYFISTIIAGAVTFGLTARAAKRGEHATNNPPTMGAK